MAHAPEAGSVSFVTIIVVLFLIAAVATAPMALFGMSLVNRLFPSAMGPQVVRGLLVLCAIVAGNTGVVVYCDLLGLSDPRVIFVFMMVVLLASAALGWITYALTRSVLSEPTPPRHGQIYCLGVSALVIAALVLTVSDPSRYDVDWGFAAATLMTSAGAVYAGLRIWRGSDQISAPLRRLVLFGAAAALAIGALSVAGDALQAVWTDLPSLPLSPVALLVASVCICVGLRRFLPRQVNRAETLVPEGLTEREAEVFALWMAGDSREEIAESLFVSPHTVKNHIHAIYQKTGAAGRWELAQRYGRAGD